jgi:hypothetical protein
VALVSGVVAAEALIAEDVQLMLVQERGRLEFDRVIPVAAVLLELVLLGRVSSQAKKGFFADPVGRLLIVVDPSPTGRKPLDIALAALVSRGKPWLPDRAMLALSATVVPAVHASLQASGLVRVEGSFDRSRGHLEIVDAVRVDARREILARARTLPATVRDPRLGAVVDLLRNSGNLYRGEAGILERLGGDWYPEGTVATITAILSAEGLIKESN